MILLSLERRRQKDIERDVWRMALWVHLSTTSFAVIRTPSVGSLKSLINSLLPYSTHRIIGFREIISLISMLLSKTDFSITKNYDDLLVDPDLMSLGNEVRNKLVETRQAVIDVSGAKDISGPHIQLMRASSIIRNPYVDSINVVQAEILKVLRNMPEDDSPDLTPELKAIKSIRNDALLLSIKGIAQGMKNSG